MRPGGDEGENFKVFLEFFHKSISYHGGDNYCTSRKCECIAQKKLFEVIYSYNQLLFTEAMLCSRHCAKYMILVFTELKETDNQT